MSKLKAKLKRIFLTYTKTHKTNGKVYSGRASGQTDADKILAQRDGSHHKNKEGYQKAQLDQISNNKNAIRGREQELIEHYGGAQSQSGTSGNKINGISK